MNFFELEDMEEYIVNDNRHFRMNNGVFEIYGDMSGWIRNTDNVNYVLEMDFKLVPPEYISFKQAFEYMNNGKICMIDDKSYTFYCGRFTRISEDGTLISAYVDRYMLGDMWILKKK